MTGGKIIPAPRTSPAGIVIILLSLALNVALPVTFELDGGLKALRLITAGQGLLLAAALGLRRAPAVHLTLLHLLLDSWLLLRLWPHDWPFQALVPLVVYLVFCLTVPPLRRGLGWFRPGRMDSRAWLLTAVAGTLAAVALVSWSALVRPDLGPWRVLVPGGGLASVIAAGLGFSLLNAAMEEGFFRGAVQYSLESALGEGWGALLLQAAAFGVMHLQGIPHGWLGVAMATVFGFVMGYARRTCGGMLAPIFAHAIADIVIFCLIAAMVR